MQWKSCNSHVDKPYRLRLIRSHPKRAIKVILATVHVNHFLISVLILAELISPIVVAIIISIKGIDMKGVLHKCRSYMHTQVNESFLGVSVSS